MKSKYGVDSMPETAENVAEYFNVSRADQDAFAFRTQQRWAKANEAGFFADEMIPVSFARKERGPKEGAQKTVDADEHPRPDTMLEALAKLKPVVKANGTVTAGNASGINDGACALLLASAEAVKRFEADAAGPRHCDGDVGSGAEDYGFCAGSRDTEAFGEDGAAAFRNGRD